MEFRAFKSAVAAVTLLGPFGFAFAQQTLQSTDSDATLQEIVITANKREERLSEVGLAVSVLSGADLSNNQITSLADLAKSIPGLSYANSANGTPVYTLRGVGFYETSIGSYPTVSIYQDQVPLAFPVLTRHSAFDLERVEVLKGPQGTLFGQNSTGGAINYIAAKPTDDFQAGFGVSYGRFNDVLADAFISGPLNGQMRGRLAIQSDRGDGWQHSNSRPGDTNGRTDYDSLRLQLEYTPSDSIHLLLAMSSWWDRSDTQAPQFFGFNLQQPVPSTSLRASQFSPLTPQAADWTPGGTSADNSMNQFSLRGDFRLTDELSLTSITAYTHYRQNQSDDGDGLPISDDDLTSDRGTINSISQELRVSNAGDQRYRWVGGISYDSSGALQNAHVDYADSTVDSTFGQPNFFYTGSPPYPIRAADYSTRQNFQDSAVFGNIDFDVIPTVTVKAGARYTDSKDRAKACSANLSDLVGGTGQFFYDLLEGGAYGPYVAGDCFPINSTTASINGVAPGAPGQYAGDLDQRNVSWRGGVDWKPSDGVLLYLNVAKGFKAGSFPTLSASAFVQYLPVREESILSYEGGAKLSLLDHRVEVEAAAFYYDYKDKQLRSKILAEPFGILDTLQNIPKSTVKGAELSLNARPLSGLSVNVAATYLQATINEFSGINAGGLAANFDDTPMPFTPKWQIGANAEYTRRVSSNWNAFVGTSVNFRSSTVAIVGGNLQSPVNNYNVASGLPNSPVSNPYVIDQYTLLDARVGLQSADERWRFSIWGKNLTNRYYWTNVVDAFDALVRYSGMPATYGVSAAYKFKAK